MDFDKLREAYAACDPTKPLEPDHRWNVDIDAAPGRVRGRRWVEYLARKIAFSEEPALLLFTGLPGSGKSTELKRLAARLSSRRDSRSAYLPVFVDAEALLDLTARIDLPDILAAVLARVEQAVLEVEGRSGRAGEGPLARFWEWMKSTVVELQQVELDVGGQGLGVAVVLALKEQPGLREQVRAILARQFTHFLRELRGALSELDERARRAGWEDGLLVIVDSLEKLRGTSTSFHEVLSSAEQVFSRGAPYLRLPVPVLYTLPPSLTARIRGWEFMPVVRLREKGAPLDRLDPEGRAVLRELVARRLDDAFLADFLGSDYEERLDAIFRLSGGYPRELLRLLSKLLLAEDFPVPEAEFELVLNELRAEYRQVVPAAAYDWLVQVERGDFLIPQGDEHRPLAEELLSTNSVLYYYNGEPWWGLHPAVRDIPELQRRLRAGDGGAGTA